MILSLAEYLENFWEARQFHIRIDGKYFFGKKSKLGNWDISSWPFDFSIE